MPHAHKCNNVTGVERATPLSVSVGHVFELCDPFGNRYEAYSSALAGIFLAQHKVKIVPNDQKGTPRKKHRAAVLVTSRNYRLFTEKLLSDNV